MVTDMNNNKDNKNMKIISKIKNATAGLFLLLAAVTVTSCQSGLNYDPAPEEYYTDVDLYTSYMFSRYVFYDCVYAKNYDKYTTYMAQTQLSTSKLTWTNNTGSDYTLADGTVVAAGQTIDIPSGLQTMTTRDDASAPDGKIYVITFYVPSKVTYQTANKGYLFDLNKYTGSDNFTLVDGENGKSEKVQGDLNVKQLVISLVSNQNYGTDTTWQPLNGAPELGKPGDYSEPRQYMITNNMYRPSGVEATKRIYEVKVVQMPA